MAKTSFDFPRANLSRLMNMTPRDYYSRKGQCRVVAQQYGAGSRVGFQRSRPKNPVYYNEARCSITCPSGKRRYSYVRFYGPPDPRTPVWVWCSCEDFAYRLEWVLTKIGCSSLATGYSGQGVPIINEPPDIKNPQKKPGLCKHLLIAAEIALRQTKDYASQMGAEAVAVAEAKKRASMNSQPGQIMTFKK
jgi:hypothetical protein